MLLLPRPSPPLLYIIFSSDSLEAFGPEHTASVTLQRSFRGFRVRQHLSEFDYYAREIQRVYRGHLGRKRVRRALDAREITAVLAVHHYAATRIQSVFKGSYSRKYIHDFYARKKYVEEVVARGEMLRGELEAKFARELRAELERREAAARESFQKATQGLHHLVSTKQRAGVYNPPWATRRADVPSAFGVALEVHLRTEVLRTIRTRGLHAAATEASRAATAVAQSGEALNASITLLGHTAVTVVPAYASQGSRASIQASSAYDAPLNAARAEARASKLAFLDARPLLAGTRGRHFTDPQPLGVHASTPYQEPWLAARGDRETEHVRKHSTWVAQNATPFVASSSKGDHLFEDSERAAALKATVVVASSAAHAQAAPGAFVKSIRIGNTVIPAAKGSVTAVLESATAHEPARTQALLSSTFGGGGGGKSGDFGFSGGTATSGSAAGSAMAAARAGRSAASSGSSSSSNSRFTAPALPSFPATNLSASLSQIPLLKSRQWGGGQQAEQLVGESAVGVNAPPIRLPGSGVSAPTSQRRRPLMKPLPALQKELPPGLPAEIAKLTATFSKGAAFSQQ